MSDTHIERMPAPWAARGEAVLEADTERFDRLIELSGLDPKRHLRLANWSGVDFSGSDLRGFDFSGANLRNCNFDGSLVEGARFDQAEINGTDLRAARDWEAHLHAWQPSSRRVRDRYLPEGAVFQDAPFAPELVVVPSGRFRMGSPEDEEGRFGDEDPRHEVTVPERLAVGRYAVTFEEWDFANASEDWQRVTKLEPRMPDDKEWGRNRRPVINVSWEDAQAYIKWLRRKMGHDYRLLSEAEWEYCCRSGSQTRYCFGDEAERLAKYAWYDDNSGNQTHPVGERLANAWGLYDMHGNVWEWCEDVWHDSYADKPAELNETGSAWTAGGSGTRVLRGGSWFFNPRFLRSAYRFRSTPGYGNDGDGFRVARTLTS